MTFRQVPHVHLLFFRPSQLSSLRRSHPTCIASPMWKAPAEPRISAGAYIIYACANGDLDEALPRARALVSALEEEPHVNPSTGTAEFSLRDPDGYYVTLSALDAA